MNDQTANLYPDEIENNIKGKRVLIIGSGSDLDGRRLEKKIDSDYYDYIIRINKHYGLREDSGTRTDIIFTRWVQWINKGINFFTDEDIQNSKKIIIINQNVGVSLSEIEQGKLEIGHDKVSAGVIACLWCINRGVKEIDIIGFGHYQDGWHIKSYCQNSFNYNPRMKDNNPLYDWDKEKRWLMNQPEINLI